MTATNPNLLRLDALEKEMQRLKVAYAQIVRDNAVFRELAEWAVKEIMTRQEAELEIDKRWRGVEQPDILSGINAS